MACLVAMVVVAVTGLGAGASVGGEIGFVVVEGGEMGGEVEGWGMTVPGTGGRGRRKQLLVVN